MKKTDVAITLSPNKNSSRDEPIFVARVEFVIYDGEIRTFTESNLHETIDGTP